MYPTESETRTKTLLLKLGGFESKLESDQKFDEIFEIRRRKYPIVHSIPVVHSKLESLLRIITSSPALVWEEKHFLIGKKLWEMILICPKYVLIQLHIYETKRNGSILFYALHHFNTQFSVRKIIQMTVTMDSTQKPTRYSYCLSKY